MVVCSTPLPDPFRLVFACTSGFAQPESAAVEDQIDFDSLLDYEDNCREILKDCCGFSTILKILTYELDYVFGGYSKNTFTEIVLTGCDYSTAVGNSRFFVNQSVGSVQKLQSSGLMYEVFGTFLISLISAVTFLLVAANMDAFSQETSSWYISNLFWGTFWAVVVSAITAFEFMQVFNHTGDTLLYAFTWNRKLAGKDDYKKHERFHPIKYCPFGLRASLEAWELEVEQYPLPQKDKQSAMMLFLRAGRPPRFPEPDKKRHIPPGLGFSYGGNYRLGTFSDEGSSLGDMRYERTESMITPGRPASQISWRAGGGGYN